MQVEPDKFHDIRPFTDQEFPEVKKRLINNQLLISSLRMMMWKDNPKFLIPLVDGLIRTYLKWLFLNVSTIDRFQKKIVGNYFLKWILKHSTDSLTCSGLESLDKDKSYIFISNHRDIVLDPAFIDFLLHQNGHRVPYIAFGDNLLVNDMVSDLIRINKAFIVKRNLPLKPQLKALKHLSEYINKILSDGHHIWIAQREGRAKDGLDQTNPAIVKMFHLAERKNQPDFSAYIKSIRLVPVAISYEKDPCDRIKARQLHMIKQRGSYRKKSKDDMIAMAAGIGGAKGHIHARFAEPLSGDFKDEKEVAAAIDKAIQRNYKLWPRNYIAFDELEHSTLYASQYSQKEKEDFLGDYQNLKPEVREILLQIYANPVKSKTANTTD